MGRKHTDAEVQARRLDVEDLLSSGCWTTRAIRKLARQHGVKPRTVYDDRAIILRELRETVIDADPVDRKVSLLTRSQSLYRTSLASDQNATALRCLEFEAAIVGAKEPVRVSIEHSLNAMDELEHARAIVEEYEEAIRVLQDHGEPIPAPKVIEAQAEPVD